MNRAGWYIWCSSTSGQVSGDKLTLFTSEKTIRSSNDFEWLYIRLNCEIFKWEKSVKILAPKLFTVERFGVVILLCENQLTLWDYNHLKLRNYNFNYFA